ncbi:MAG: MFS transporter [Kineosporiaceae bacterium]|nr:MFS transporter [Kineosporiaceae bacterium]
MRRYASILRRRGALAPFLAAFAARLPVSMVPLGMVLLIQSVRGSYSVAGVITAMYTIGVALASPGWGALIDRIGQPWVIGPLSLTSALLLAGLAQGVVAGLPDSALIVLAVGVGLTFPPISPAMRAAWRVILDDEADRRAAYALEAVVIEVMFVGGPLLLSALLVVDSAQAPLLLVAGLLGVAGLGYALTGAARAWRPEPHASGAHVRGRSPLRSLGVVASLAVGLLVAVGFGQLDVALAATAGSILGDQARVGLLFTAIAGGSAIGGTVYGALVPHRPGADHGRLPFVLAGFAAGLALVTLAITRQVSSLAVLMPLLFLTGLAIAPGLIMLANLVDESAPRDRLTQAQAWLTTAFTAGAAAGTALAGLLIDRGGPRLGFGGASLALVIAVVIAILAQRVWRRLGVPRGHGEQSEQHEQHDEQRHRPRAQESSAQLRQ